MSASLAVAAAPVRVLTPDARPRERLPRLALGLLALSFGMSLLAGWTGISALRTADQLCFLFGLPGAWGLAAWLEERGFVALSGRGPLVRLAAALATPPAGFGLGLAATAALAAISGALGGSGLFAVQGLAATLWFTGAALGSLVILGIDVLISALFPGFRSRVTLAVLALVGLVFAGSIGVAAAGLALVEALQEGRLPAELDLRASGEDGVAELKSAIEYATAHPLLLVLGLFGLVALLALPSVISASGKLAEAVMDRIHPLAAALAAVRKGERELHLEEAGSRDFVLVSKSFNEMVDTLRLAERMERAFGLYVSGHVMDRIRAQHGEAVIPPALREATVFFADIRGFTSMSERLPPDQVVALLNRYFTRVVQVVDAQQGYLNKFIGDAVVVVFNGPIDQPDHAERATRCAIALQELVAQLNAEGAFPEVGTLAIGVGVSTGPMVCGNIGSDRQMEYTVIGDTVNLSARLTSLCGAGEVWISERTAALLPASLPAEVMPAVKVKGKEQAVVPYRAHPSLPPAASAR